MFFFTLLPILLICFSYTEINGETADSLITRAWNYWDRNDQQKVEQTFREAIEADPQNLRAYIGLAFLYEFQRKDAEAWAMYQNIIKTEKNYYPYVFASWYSDKTDPRNGAEKAGLVPFLEQLTTNADSNGTLRAMACYLLGEYYQQKGDLKKANSYFGKMNTIDQWTVIGPFQNISASGYDKVYPPEKEYDTSKTYWGKNDVPCKWFKLNATSPSNWIDYERYFAYSSAVFYANNFIFSPSDVNVQIRIGVSGMIKAFLNDVLIVADSEETNNDLDSYMIDVMLKKGWNRFLLKCGQSEISKCNFLVRITDNSGMPIDGIHISTDPQDYNHDAVIQSNRINRFAEIFFKEKIKNNPTYIENYVLLSECYRMYGKISQSEQILHKAINMLPNCAFLYDRMWGFYYLNQKYDEARLTREKIFMLDKTIPKVIENKISEALDNEDYDKAENLLKELEIINPESEYFLMYSISLYLGREQEDKVSQLNHTAYKKYPNNIFFAVNEANLSSLTDKKYDKAIKIMGEHLKHTYTEEGVKYLSDYYIKASQVEKGLEIFAKLFELDPASPGYYDYLADRYIDFQEYEKAEKSVLSALTICPNSYAYWAKLGKIYAATNDIAGSVMCYKKALQYEPTDYDSRHRLRELENKKPVFNNFVTYNIDSLINAAPRNEQYPNDGAVYLLEDYNQVVYDKGISEIRREELIKVFNSRGIDDFKEYWITYNPYNQKMLVDECIVIKSDGSKIKADINDYQIVFKTLEPNDIIHIKWTIKNYYTGILSKYFWNKLILNGFYPRIISHYGLIVPDSVQFSYRTINTDITPYITDTPDGKRYDWLVLNDSSVRYESSMSFANDAAKTLYISSIPDWRTIVDWYNDLANTKAKSTYEVHDQVDALIQGRINVSEEEKIRLIYNFIIENIRYSYVSFRQSAFVPQNSRDVLVSKIGDCKDLAALGISMFNEVGIKAYYVLVKTKDEGRCDNALPSVDFNHCIIAVETQKGMQYLDLTATNYPVKSVPEMDIDAFALLINPFSLTPFYIKLEDFEPRNIICEGEVKIRDDNSANIVQNVLRTGAMTASIRNSYRHKDQQQNEKEMAEALNAWYPGVHISEYIVENPDSIFSKIRHSVVYDVPSYVTDAGRLKIMKIPWWAKARPWDGVSYQQRHYPLYFHVGFDTIRQSVKIELPVEYYPEEIIPKVSHICSVAEYFITYKYSKGILNVDRSLIIKGSVIYPEQYAEFKKFYESVMKEDERQLVLNRIK